MGRPRIARSRVGLLLGLAALLLPEPSRAGETVLFVGNSFTGNLGGVGELVERMAAVSRVELTAEQIAPGGYSFEQHFEAPDGARSAIVDGGWDRVVLQEQSGRPIFQRQAFERYGRLLVAEVVSTGARPLLYATWGRADHPQDQQALTEAYCELSAETRVDLAPVGAAWQRARTHHPELRLHAADGVHASLAGFYLAALVLYGSLTGEDPRGLPPALDGVVWVTATQARQLQEIAGETLAAHRRGEICGSTLHLLGGRFEVDVEFRDFFGGEGPGRPVSLTDDTGAFWFFEPDNLELMIKVLDGRSVNGAFWVFYGALSNVAYTITVRDTFTARSKVYENPSGTLASRADTRAFAGDG